MSRTYWNAQHKTVQPAVPNPLWTLESCSEMEEIFESKGHEVSVSVGVAHDGQLYNTWVVPRDQIGFDIEELFKRRHIVEVEPHKHNVASIYFVCRDHPSSIFEWLYRIPKNRGN